MLIGAGCYSVRIANLPADCVLVTADGTGALDVGAGQPGPVLRRPAGGLRKVAGFTSWAAGIDLAAAVPFAAADLGAPAPAPRQVLAIGLNYAEHAAESGFDVPEEPTVMFTKWPSCLTGPVTEVELPAGGHTDWEVELVAVIGRRAFRISAADAWDHVAGLTVGQDLSERILQGRGPVPAVQPGEVAARLRAHRAVAGDAGRVRRPQRPRTRLLG